MPNVYKDLISEEEKLALTQAYVAGIEKAAADAGLEKDALLAGLLGKGLMRLGGLGLKGMSGAASLTAKPFAWAGRMAERGLQKALPNAKWLKPGPGGEASALRSAFKGTPKDMASFGLFSGGLSALSAEPGERGDAFLKGFVPGALGGLGWGVGSNLASKGLGRLGIKQLAAKKVTPEMALGQKAKIYASKAVAPVATMGTGLAGSMALDPSMYGSGQAIAGGGQAAATAPATRPMAFRSAYGFYPAGGMQQRY